MPIPPETDEQKRAYGMSMDPAQLTKYRKFLERTDSQRVRGTYDMALIYRDMRRDDDAIQMATTPTPEVPTTDRGGGRDG